MATTYQSQRIYEYLENKPNSTVKEVAENLGLRTDYCHSYIGKLLKGQFLKVTGGKGVTGNPRRFSVISGKAPKFGQAPEKGTKRPARNRFKKRARQKLWNNIKIERKFSIKSILASIDVPYFTAASYIRQLVRAGYVELFSDGKKAKGRTNGTVENRYLLVRDTGRLAPIGRKDGCWDQNEQKLYPYTQGTAKRKALGERKEDVTHDMA